VRPVKKRIDGQISWLASGSDVLFLQANNPAAAMPALGGRPRSN
jgi:hypothetical protein